MYPSIQCVCLRFHWWCCDY